MTFSNNWPSIFTLSSPQHRSREAQLAYDLDIARQRLAALEEEPQILAVVLSIDGDQVFVSTGPQTLTVRKPKMMDGLDLGCVVRLLAKKPAILSVVKEPSALGTVHKVRAVIDERHAEIEGDPHTRIVLVGVKDGVRVGDRVLLDLTSSSVVKNLGPGDQVRAFTADTGVSWDDIGGLEDVKRELREAIEEPVRESELYARYGRLPVRGVLLWGPPGCGKTMLGKAAATALAATHGATARASGFQYVKGPELLNKFVGASEENIRSVFAAARAHRERHGYPAIVFIDEADALMAKRGSGLNEGMERTIVPQFLAEMDGLGDAGAMVLLATNRPDSLDPAVVRDGRIDRKVHVRRPNETEAGAIFRALFERKPMAYPDHPASLATAGVVALFDDRHALFMVRTKSGSDQRFGLRHLVSGAMIAGIVERATQFAMRREMAKEASKGLSCDDVVRAVTATLAENRGVDHSAELRVFVDGIGNVTKVTPVAA